ncbi:TPA: hypothetical protein QDA71_004319 [Burkholderia vietnamiensis]|uniref:hypothetical protein n=1 Tax=Burkholderia vietnamiensis TaxID=60552 RepID=UPI001592403E|nr:hypothetical protein [Burkholderia vietnamiensis]HDR8947290.1 hypothetical protein [Burkholderia vietnamiensis]HDR9210042.1 hypothetical protein [Burkholderia vietnamiensis]
MNQEPSLGGGAFSPINRNEIREMCEENWRQFLQFAADGSKELGQQVILRFDEKNKARAAQMEPDDGASFLQAVEEEREKIFDEYSANPEALKRRLGVTAGRAHVAERSHRQGMGEMAVKTAVRASIWAAIWSLFR